MFICARDVYLCVCDGKFHWINTILRKNENLHTRSGAVMLYTRPAAYFTVLLRSHCEFCDFSFDIQRFTLSTVYASFFLLRLMFDNQY